MNIMSKMEDKQAEITSSDHDKANVSDKMHFTDVYVGFVKLALYRLFRLVFNVIRSFFWILNGTFLDHWRSSDPNNYDRSAHVYNVVYRYKFDLVLGQSSFADFVLCHARFVHPLYVLRDDCSLYQVTADQAIFVQVEEGVDVWRASHGSFLRQAQFELAKKVITMPLSSAIAVAGQLGRLDARLVFVQNTARCGSTLLVRMFEMTGRCVTFSEPDAVNGLCKLALARRAWDVETSRRLVRSVVRLLCKPIDRLSERPLAYVLKMTAPSMEAGPFLAKIFPEAYQLFMYRNSVDVARSLAVAAEQMPTLKLVYLLGSLSPAGLRFAVSRMGCSNTEYRMTLSGHPYDAGIVLYGITVGKYLQMLQQGIPIAGVRYEDLTDDRRFFIDRILEYCHLPSDLSDRALEATGSDAQQNSPLSISNLSRKRKNYLMTPAVAAMREAYFRQIGVPVEAAAVLPNTITHRPRLIEPEVLDAPSGNAAQERPPERIGAKSGKKAALKECHPASTTGVVRNVKLIATLKTTKSKNDVIETISRLSKNCVKLDQEKSALDSEENKTL